MKKLLTIVLLLLTAASAEARQVSTDLLVVTCKSNKAAGATQGKSDVILGKWIDQNVTAILNEWGVDYYKYDVANLPTGKMNWLRTGKVVLGPDTVTARAVLHERFSRRGASFDYPIYRPDSLCMARAVNGTPMLPSVPTLFVLEPNGANSDFPVVWTRATSCSTGSSAFAPVIGGTGVGHECEACEYTPASTGGYFSSSVNNGAALDLATVGGVRAVVAPYTNLLVGPADAPLWQQGYMPSNPMRGLRADTPTDTTDTHGYALQPRISATPDTAFVWKRNNAGWNVLDKDGATVAAAQMIFAMGPAVLGFDDNSAATRTEYMYQSTFLGLCALDSLLGGNLLGARKVRGHDAIPKKIGLTLDGGFARCAQQFSTGTYITDSAAVKATLDSIAARGIPYLVGVNVDSVASYPYERAWYKGSPRFTPQVWRGADGGVCDTTTRNKLTDLFGHSRARTAYGPATFYGSAGDTSTYALIRYAFARCDSLFPGRSSRFLLPPYDDIVPTNTALADSVLIAARLAGASGIRINGLDSLRRSMQTFNLQGAYFGLKALAHTGEIVTGGSRILATTGSAGIGGTFDADSGYAYTPMCGINDKFLTALVRGRWHAYSDGVGSPQFGASASAAKPNTGGDLFAYDANWTHNVWCMAGRGCLLKAGMSTLGGATYVASLKQPQGNPLRPSWWVIRSVDGFRAVANAVAGRTVIMWAYPESIEP